MKLTPLLKVAAAACLLLPALNEAATERGRKFLRFLRRVFSAEHYNMYARSVLTSYTASNYVYSEASATCSGKSRLLFLGLQCPYKTVVDVFSNQTRLSPPGASLRW